MKKMMHIVEAFGGGVYSFLTELCNSLTDEYEVIIVCSERKETPENFIKDFDEKIKFINLEMKRSINSIKNINALIKLKKIIVQEKPDIVHLHSSIAGFLGRLACYFNGFDMKKVYYNPHGLAFLQKNENYIKRLLFYWLEKIGSKFGGTIVACSEGEYEEIKKFTVNVIRINNAINTEKIDRIIDKINVENYKKTKIKIGTIGRISYGKNPKLFNEIAENFLDYEFIWIGDGELKNELKSNNIKVTGWLNREEVIKELLDLDIFIMTSLWEGMPIALLEAMYVKKPVIVSDVIGNHDVIKNFKNGFVAKNSSDYIRYIKLFLQNEKMRYKIVNSAAEDIITNYSIDNMTWLYKNIYKKYSN